MSSRAFLELVHALHTQVRDETLAEVAAFLEAKSRIVTLASPAAAALRNAAGDMRRAKSESEGWSLEEALQEALDIDKHMSETEEEAKG